MSITKDFEDRYWEDERYSATRVEELLTHARALEVMLKKHEFVESDEYEESTCPECLGSKPGSSGEWERAQPEYHEGHSKDCPLAKLIEGVE